MCILKDVVQVLAINQLLLIGKVYCDIIYHDSVIFSRFIYSKLQFKEDKFSLGSCLSAFDNIITIF